MAELRFLSDVSLSSPTMIEGFPGLGLVGKIAADHTIETFDMTHYANVHCESIPKAAMYAEGEASLRTPVRLYADGERDLLVLRADVPIGPGAAEEFADCITPFFDDHDVTPLYLSGAPSETSDEVPSLYGVGVGAGVDRLSEAGIGEPTESGLVSGPTGALLAYAVEHDLTAMGLVVETDPRFPDPGAARVLIKDGIEPLTGTEIPVDDLVERAEEIRQARDKLAKRMQEADEESTQAQRLRMYQ